MAEMLRHSAWSDPLAAPLVEGAAEALGQTCQGRLAGVGRGQLRVLDERVDARRGVNAFYRERLGGPPGISFMPETPGRRSTFWLTCIQVDADVAGFSREDLRLVLARGRGAPAPESVLRYYAMECFLWR